MGEKLSIIRPTLVATRFWWPKLPVVIVRTYMAKYPRVPGAKRHPRMAFLGKYASINPAEEIGFLESNLTEAWFDSLPIRIMAVYSSSQCCNTCSIIYCYCWLHTGNIPPTIWIHVSLASHVICRERKGLFTVGHMFAARPACGHFCSSLYISQIFVPYSS